MSKIFCLCNNTKRDLAEYSTEFVIYYNGHKSVCELNHSGLSTSMEMDSASVIWKISLDYGFQYNTLLPDGNAKTFTELLEQQIYGKGFMLKKEECIKDVSKRLGIGLRNVVKNCRVRVLH